MNYARFVFNTFQHCMICFDGKVIHEQEDTHMLNVFNHLEYIGIACFLKDFQHGILNPFVSTIRLPLPRRDLRRPPPLREEVRFFVAGGRFPSIGDRECSVGSVESFSKWPDLNACYV